jgi:hypothetical protein
MKTEKGTAMIDNTVIIQESIRIRPRIIKVYVAYVTNDIDYNRIENVLNAVPIHYVHKAINENDELILTATAEFDNAVQYNRVFFVDAHNQIENILKIETKTQKLVRIDLKLSYKSEHTIGRAVCA